MKRHNLQHIFSELINAVIESAPQPKIITPEYEVMAQFHLLVTLPFGLGKTSLFKNIDQVTKVHFLTDYTMPGLIGTISKDGDFVPGAVTNCGNGVLVVDEAHRLSKHCSDALNSFLTHGWHSRSMGYLVRNPGRKYGNLSKLGWEVLTNPNGFRVDSRFSCIWLGEKIHRYHEEAFLSRFFPLFLKPTREEVMSFISGQPFLNFTKKQEKFKVFREPTVFSKPVFNYLYDRFCEKCSKVAFDDDQYGYLVRANTHLIQLAAHFARLKGRVKVSKNDCDKAISFADLLIQGYKLLKLTPFELKILDFLQKNPQFLQENPKNLQKNPQNLQENPQNLQENPQNLQENPQNLQKNPQNLQKNPQNSQKNPQNLQKNPQKMRSELAIKLGVLPPQISAYLKKLESKGFISRRENDIDNTI